jgi:DNA repair protein RecO (recombination protein O)
MEWEAVGIVVSATPFGEGDAIATLLTEEHGAHRGMVRGCRSRSGGRSTWEVGNVLRAKWVGRLAEQLGTFSGEVLQSPASNLLDVPLELSMLASACAVAAGALPERAACARTFEALVWLLAGLSSGRAGAPALVRWELTLLDELGYGLDLSRCAVSGASEGLAFVSPRSGCAVSESEAEAWRDRLLRLPGFVLDPAGDEHSSASDWHDGLRLTGHFLTRDAFGIRHQPLPAVRSRLLDMVVRLGGTE